MGSARYLLAPRCATRGPLEEMIDRQMQAFGLQSGEQVRSVVIDEVRQRIEKGGEHKRITATTLRATLDELNLWEPRAEEKHIPRILPPPTNGFVGREQELRFLFDTLNLQQNVVAAVAVVGMAGIGKSSLVAEAICRMVDQQNRFTGGIIWVSCYELTGLSGLIGVYDQILSAWNITIPIEQLRQAISMEEEAKLRERILSTRFSFSRSDSPTPPAFIFLDNLESGFPVTRALEMLAACNITTIITTRTEPSSSRFHLLRLYPLEEKAAVQLFEKHYTNRGGIWGDAQDTQPSKKVVELLGYHPLAIELAAARAARTFMSVEALAQEFQQPGVLQKLKHPLDETASVRYLFEKSLSKLSMTQRACFAALGLPDGPDWPRIVIEDLLNALLSRIVEHTSAADELEALVAYSLVTPVAAEFSVVRIGDKSGGLVARVRLHPLLREFAREEWDKQTDEVQEATLTGILNGVGGLVKEYENSHATLEREVEMVAGALRRSAHKKALLPQFIEITGDLADYFTIGGQWRLGIEMFKLRLNAIRENGEQEQEAITLLILGNFAQNLGRNQEANDFYKEALVIFQDLKDLKGEGIVLNNLGAQAITLGLPQKALDYFQQALVIRRSLGDRGAEATTLNNLGNLSHNMGQNREASVYYEEALAILRELGTGELDQRVHEGTALNNIGLIADAEGNHEKAAECYQEALKIHREVGNRAMEGTTLNNLGLLAEHQGHIDEAVDYYHQALPILQLVGDRVMEGITLNNLGMIAMRQRQFVEATSYLNLALELQRAVGNRGQEGAALHNLGRIEEAQKHYNEASNYYLQALLIAREVSNRSEEGTALNNLGHTSQSQGKVEEAMNYCQQALKIAHELGNRGLEAATLSIIGSIMQEQELHEKATRCYQQALAISREVGDQDMEGKMLNNLGTVAYALGRYKQAKQYFQQALISLEEVNTGDNFSMVVRENLAATEKGNALLFKHSRRHRNRNRH